MSIVTSALVFLVGLFAGRVTQRISGIVAVLALLIALTSGTFPETVIGTVTAVTTQYYTGNELLFLAGFLFGIDRAIVTHARRHSDSLPR